MKCVIFLREKKGKRKEKERTRPFGCYSTSATTLS